MSTFDIGDQPTMVVTFKASDGTLTSPTAITFEVLKPSDVDGSPSTSQDETAATEASTGIWHYVLPQLDEEGWWRVRASGTAGIVAVVEQRFQVRATRFN